MSQHKKIAKIRQNEIDGEPTLQDVLNAVNTGFSDIETRMVTKDEFNHELGQIKGTIDTIQAKIGTMVTKDEFKEELAQMETRLVTKDEFKEGLAQMETRLVTKDYLDEKMNDLRGDLTVSLRKEDQKVVTLVSVLQARKVLSKKDAQRVMAMELFPRQA